MWMLVRIRETWGTKFSGLSPLGVTLWSESCCHLLSVLSNTGGETRTLNHTSWIYFTQHKLNILYTTQVPRDLCRTDLIMSCHFVWVMEKYLVLLRFKEMRIKEHPEAGRLHHQLSTESRWTGQGTLAKTFLIGLSQAIDSASFWHVWVARCVWGVWDEGERLKEATECMGWCRW